MTTLALGHYLRLYTATDNLALALQNFYIGQQHTHQGTTYLFAPFGFSGLTTSRQADNAIAQLVFPNDAISRGYADDSMRGNWIAEVDVNVLDPDTRAVQMTLYTYAGAVSAASWDETALVLSLNSVLDAVSGDVPTRTLHQRLVGAIPSTSTLRLR